MDEGFKRNKVIDFERNSPRPDFVNSMGSSINENRFSLEDNYDKSTYLTKAPRVKHVIDFGLPSSRLANIIDKGGDNRIDLGGKSSVMIDQGLEYRTVMRRLDKGVTNLKQRTNRETTFGNMYLQEPDFTPDHYDSLKIAEAANKIKKRI